MMTLSHGEWRSPPGLAPAPGHLPRNSFLSEASFLRTHFQTLSPKEDKGKTLLWNFFNLNILSS